MEYVEHPTPSSSPAPKTPSTWEYTLGFDHQLAATSASRIQSVYKETKNQIGWYIDDDGEYDELRLDRPGDRQYFTLRDYSTEPTR